jgi:hypothetical protein
MYSPKISEALIPTLYRMAKDRGVPMTMLVNQIIDKEIRKQKRKELRGGEAGDCFKRESRAEKPVRCS